MMAVQSYSGYPARELLHELPKCWTRSWGRRRTARMNQNQKPALVRAGFSFGRGPWFHDSLDVRPVDLRCHRLVDLSRGSGGRYDEHAGVGEHQRPERDGAEAALGFRRPGRANDDEGRF